MKVYFNQESNELFVRGRYCAAFDGIPHAVRIMKCFDEEHYPQQIFDPVPPPAILGLTPEARKHIHVLELDRTLRAMNGEIAVTSEDEGWTSPPCVFLYDAESESIVMQDLGSVHPEQIDVV